MIESFLTFFALWGVGFWLLTIIASIVFIVGCEKDLLGLSIFTTFIFSLIYYKKLLVLLANPTILLIVFIGWIIVGIMWSCWRWNTFVGKIIKYHNETKTNLYTSKIELVNNKTRIINWIVYWPWSMLWNLTGDFFQSIYEAMEGVYQKITDRQLSKLKDDVERI